jgi:hypothetical protein
MRGPLPPLEGALINIAHEYMLVESGLLDLCSSEMMKWRGPAAIVFNYIPLPTYPARHIDASAKTTSRQEKKKNGGHGNK